MKINFIHISDTHIGSETDFLLHDINTYQCTQNLIKLIKDFNAPVDFILHSGDIVNRPHPKSYELADQAFSETKYPLIYVPGNHDDPASVRKLNRIVPKSCYLNNDNSSFTFEFNGYRILVLDCNGKPEIDPHGIFEKAQEAALDRYLKENSSPRIVFLHFPPISMDIPWVDRDMLLLNGENLHNRLANDKNGAVSLFFGHIHRRVSLIKDGISYFSAPSPFCQFGASPLDQEVIFQPGKPVSFNYVTISENGVLVREVT